jgi:hypothetical protein
MTTDKPAPLSDEELARMRGNPQAWWMDEVRRLLATIEARDKEIADLLAVVKDYEDDAARIFDEECGHGQVHCTCVPALRKRIEELEAENVQLRADLDAVTP